MLEIDVSVKRIRHNISSPPYGIYSSVINNFIKYLEKEFNKRKLFLQKFIKKCEVELFFTAKLKKS